MRPIWERWVALFSGRFATVALLLGTLILGIYGIGRSLWLDEVWVANSVNAPTLSGMFQYPNWLQTSPPLFLLLARASIRVFGLSNTSLRAVPLALALVAVAGMLAVGRRVVAAPFAVLACAILAFHPTSVEYFRSFKQYSGEVAATSLVLLATIRYLQSPKRNQFYWLLGAVAFAMPLSYPTVFLLPGILWSVYATNGNGLARSGLLASVAGSVLAILYWWFIRPNLSSALRVYWSAGGRDLLTALSMLLLGAVAAVCLATWPRSGIRERIELVCVLPFGPFGLAEAAGWYPQSPRTSLFLRPCLFLLLIFAAETVSARVLKSWSRTAKEAVVLLVAILIMALGIRKQFHEGRFQPEEDFAGVIRYLHKNVAPNDLLLVHASMREGFLLYSTMQGWTPQNVIYGDTGWPCCPRGKAAAPQSSTEAAVIADLNAKIPRTFAGRIWLFHSARPSHWDYVGLDEGDSWQLYFWNRNCHPGPYTRFPNLGVTPMICEAVKSP